MERYRNLKLPVVIFCINYTVRPKANQLKAIHKRDTGILAPSNFDDFCMINQT